MRFVPAALAIGGVFLHVYYQRGILAQTYSVWIGGTRNTLRSSMRDVDRPVDYVAAFYELMQSTVPVGAPLLVMADHTYHYDQKRNPIYNFDQPGAVSPPPYVPYFKGPQAFAQYFNERGIRYVSFIVGASPEYTYPIWKQRAAKVFAPGERGGMYTVQAAFYLDTFDNLLALTKTRRVLFHEGDYWVLDLGSSA
jgi:hypothetical protein